MDAIVTIVVPVYNAKNYITRFISSLQNQTLKNFEVIFVDDCSTDDTLEKLKGEQSRDNRFKIIHLTHNRGEGYARNQGIMAVKTPLICTADPDDALPGNSLEVRCKAFTRYDAVIRGNYEIFLPGGIMYQYCGRIKEIPEVFTPKEIANEFGPYTFTTAHCTYIFPTQFLRENNILYGENMSQGADVAMLIKSFWRVKRCVWLNDTVYYYLIRNDSATGKGLDIHTMLELDRIFYDEAKMNNNIIMGDLFILQHFSLSIKLLLQKCYFNKISDGEVKDIISKYKLLFKSYSIFDRCKNIFTGKNANYLIFFNNIFNVADTYDNDISMRNKIIQAGMLANLI